MNVTTFATQKAFRKWLEKNHAKAVERRLGQLIECSANGERLPQVTSPK